MEPITRNSTRFEASFWRLWWSTATSTFGDGLAVVALPLLALTTTRRPLLVAGVAAATQLPGLAFAPLAGALIDRWDRRALAVGAEVARFLVFAGLTAALLAGVRSLPLVYVVATVTGCCEILFLDCASASLPAVVSEERIEPAASRLGAAELSGRMLAGQGLGGAAFSLARALPFGGDAVLYGASAVMALRSIPHTPRRAAPGTSILADIRAGTAALASSVALRRLVGLIAAFAFCNAAVAAVLVLWVTGPLHLGRAGYGLLAAGGSCCAMAATTVAGRLSSRLGGAGAVALGGLLAAGGYLLLAGGASVVLAAAGVAAECAGIAIGNVASMVLRQRLAPPELLGRIMAGFRTVLMAAMLVGSLSGGLMAGWLGVRRTFLVAGLVQLLAVVAFAASALRPPSTEAVIDLTGSQPASPSSPPPVAPVTQDLDER